MYVCIIISYPPCKEGIRPGIPDTRPYPFF